MQCADSRLLATLESEVECLLAQAPIAVAFCNEKLVEECVLATELQAESEGEHHITDHFFSDFQQPNSTEDGRLQQRQRRAASTLSAKRMGVMGVEVVHHTKKDLHVIGLSRLKKKIVAQAKITLAHQIVAGDVIVAEFAKHRERNIFRAEELLSDLLYLITINGFNVFQHFIERKKVFEIQLLTSEI